MPKETEESKKDQSEEQLENEEFSNENMFNFDELEDKKIQEEEEDIKEFVNSGTIDEENKEEEEKNNEENDKFNFENNEKDNEEEKLDLEAFNKKFSTSYKSEQELKNHFKEKDNEKETSKEEEQLGEANSQIEILSPFLELDSSGTEHKIDDEGLMRSQFESIAMQENKDLNNEEIQIEIEEKIQELKDSGKLYKKASLLRGQIQNLVTNYNSTKTSIETKRTKAIEATDKQTKENLQNELIKFHSAKNFYGIDLDKKTISEVYQKVSSGEFLNNLKSDNKAIAELALMAAYKEQIFKKSTGLTYSEGIKAVVDEFKSINKGKDDQIANAQKRGSSGSSEGIKGLIADILYEKPKKEIKK